MAREATGRRPGSPSGVVANLHARGRKERRQRRKHDRAPTAQKWRSTSQELRLNDRSSSAILPWFSLAVFTRLTPRRIQMRARIVCSTVTVLWALAGCSSHTPSGGPQTGSGGTDSTGGDTGAGGSGDGGSGNSTGGTVGAGGTITSGNVGNTN